MSLDDTLNNADRENVIPLFEEDNDNRNDLPEFPVLEKWRVADGCLIGYVYQHAIYPDGNVIRTSKIVTIEKDLATTEYHRYRLGAAAVSAVANDSIEIDDDQFNYISIASKRE